MLGFAIKRLVFTICSIPVILWIMLALTRLSPVDPIQQLIDAHDYSTDKQEQAETYSSTAKRLGYNKPPFYLSLTKSNYEAEFYRFTYPLKKQFFSRFLDENYSYETTSNLYDKLQVLRSQNSNEVIENFDETPTASILIANLRTEIIAQDSIESFNALTPLIDQLIESKNSKYSLLPRFIFFGKDNQFHSKLISITSLQWGNSIIDGKPASYKIFMAFRITLMLLIMALIVGYTLGIYLGIWFHRKPQSLVTRFLEPLFYALRSLPLFVFALILLVVFTTAELSPMLKIFPAVNAYGWSSTDSFLANFTKNFNQLILPTLCISIYSLSYISRQVKTSLEREKSALYNTTGKMKGINSWQLFLHRFRNIRSILITMIGSGIVSGFAGAVLIEYIFNIPGIGRLILDSVKSNDLVILLPAALILFVASSITLLISDLLYRYYDPKIAIDEK